MSWNVVFIYNIPKGQATNNAFYKSIDREKKDNHQGFDRI